MRRLIIIILVAVIAVFVVTRFVKIGKKQGRRAPVKQSEAAFNNALELKNSAQAQAIPAFEKIIADYPATPEVQKALFEIADIYHKENNAALEKETLKKIIEQYPQDELALQAKKKLWDINTSVLFSRAETPNSLMYEVKPGDTLFKIAKNNGTTVELLMKSNNLQDSVIRPGMKLKIEKLVFSIEVSKSAARLTLKANAEVIKEYLVGIGDNNSTPVGRFKIVNRIVNPVWYKTGAVVPAGSPENILGTRWLGLSEPGYGIHGTVDLQPIGQQRTQGCIRMRNEDVEELFIIVPVGTEVVIND